MTYVALREKFEEWAARFFPGSDRLAAEAWQAMKTELSGRCGRCEKPNSVSAAAEKRGYWCDECLTIPVAASEIKAPQYLGCTNCGCRFVDDENGLCAGCGAPAKEVMPNANDEESNNKSKLSVIRPQSAVTGGSPSGERDCAVKAQGREKAAEKIRRLVNEREQFCFDGRNLPPSALEWEILKILREELP